MIADYADSLARLLAFDPALSRRVRDEVEDHLREAAGEGGAEAERAAIARFGSGREIAWQLAAAALGRQTRQAALGVLLAMACLFLAMKMRLAWYRVTEWTLCEGQAALTEQLGSIDRFAFWIALGAGVSAWLCARAGASLGLFRALCAVASIGMVAAVTCDALLTWLRLSGWEFSADFVVPLGSMGLESACACVLLFHVYVVNRRATLARATFPEMR